MSLSAYAETFPYQPGIKVPLGAYIALSKSSPLGQLEGRIVGFSVDARGRYSDLFHLDPPTEEDHQRLLQLAPSHPPLTGYLWKHFGVPTSKNSVSPKTLDALTRFAKIANRWFRKNRANTAETIFPNLGEIPFLFSYATEEQLCRNFCTFLATTPLPPLLEDTLCYALASNDGELLELVLRERRSLSPQAINTLHELVQNRIATNGTLSTALYLSAKYHHTKRVLRLFSPHNDYHDRVVTDAIVIATQSEPEAEPIVHTIYTSLSPSQRSLFQESFPLLVTVQQIPYPSVQRLLKLFVQWDPLPSLPTDGPSPQLAPDDTN